MNRKTSRRAPADATIVAERNTDAAMTLDADTFVKPVSIAVPSITKAALLRAMLDAPGGASLASLMAATGWQAHTVRAALSGLRKAGIVLDRTKVADDTIYRIVAGAGEVAIVGPGMATPTLGAIAPSAADSERSS